MVLPGAQTWGCPLDLHRDRLSADDVRRGYMVAGTLQKGQRQDTKQAVQNGAPENHPPEDLADASARGVGGPVATGGTHQNGGQIGSNQTEASEVLEGHTFCSLLDTPY